MGKPQLLMREQLKTNSYTLIRREIRVPDPPAAQSSATFNGSAVVLFWTAPRFDGGTPVTSYSIDWVSGSNGATKLSGIIDGINASERSWIVPNLPNGVLVTVSLSACNELGCGLPAPSTVSKPMEPPSSVRHLSARVANLTSIEVSFDAPVNAGGDPVFKYIVELDRVPFLEDVWAKNAFDNHEADQPNKWFQYWDLSALIAENKSMLTTRASNEPPYPKFSLLADERVKRHYGPPWQGPQNNSAGIAIWNATVQLPSEGISTPLEMSQRVPFETVGGKRRRLEKISSGCVFDDATHVLSPCRFASPCRYDVNCFEWDSASHGSCNSNVSKHSGWDWMSLRNMLQGGEHGDVPADGRRRTAACLNEINLYCAAVFMADSGCSSAPVAELRTARPGGIPHCPAQPNHCAVNPSRLSATVQNLDPGTTYYVRVTACNRAGCSAYTLSTPRSLSTNYELLVRREANAVENWAMCGAESHGPNGFWTDIPPFSQCAIEGSTIDEYTIQLNTAPPSDLVVSIEVMQVFNVNEATKTHDYVSSGTSALLGLPSNITFTPSDWTERRTIQVVPVDDQFDENYFVNYTLIHTVHFPKISNPPSVVIQPSSQLPVIVHDDPQDFSAVVVFRGGLLDKVSTLRYSTAVLPAISQPAHTVPLGEGEPYFGGLDRAPELGIRLMTEPRGIVRVLLSSHRNESYAAPLLQNKDASLPPGAEILLNGTGSAISSSRVGPYGIAVSLIFTPNNWHVPQYVPLGAVDDYFDEPAGDYDDIWEVVISSQNDSFYDRLKSTRVNVPIQDDDVSSLALVVSESALECSLFDWKSDESRRLHRLSNPTDQVGGSNSSAVLVKEGQTSCYGVRLTCEPRHAVTVHVNPLTPELAGLQLNNLPEFYKVDRFEGSNITFDPSEWDTLKLLSAKWKDDLVDMGKHYESSVDHFARSSDVQFNLEAAPEYKLNVIVEDNDVAGFVWSKTFVFVGEAKFKGADEVRVDSVEFKLVTEPLSSVNLLFTPVQTSGNRSDWDLDNGILRFQVMVGDQNYDSSLNIISPPLYPLEFHPTENDYFIDHQLIIRGIPDGILEDGVHYGRIVVNVSTADPVYRDAFAADGKNVIKVKVIDSSNPIVDTTNPPVLLEAREVETAYALRILFDKPTYMDQMKYNEERLCEEVGIFTDDTLALYGQNSVCIWEKGYGGRALRVNLGQNFTVKPCDEIRLADEVICSSNTSVIFSAGFTSLKSRKLPPTLANATFSPSGAELIVHFDGISSELIGGVSRTGSCDEVFTSFAGKNAVDANGGLLGGSGCNSGCDGDQRTSRLNIIETNNLLAPHTERVTDLLGYGAECTWVDRSKLVVRLGHAPSILGRFRKEGEKFRFENECAEGEMCRDKCGSGGIEAETRALYLRPGGVRPSPESVYAAEGCISVAIPSSGLIPPLIADLHVPKKLWSCEPTLVLDATQSIGNGARAFSFVSWSVMSRNASSNSLLLLQNALAEAAITTSAPNSNLRLLLNASLLEVGAKYRFTVTLQSFGGISYSSKDAVVIRQGAPVPRLSILGPETLHVQYEAAHRMGGVRVSVDASSGLFELRQHQGPLAIGDSSCLDMVSAQATGHRDLVLRWGSRNNATLSNSVLQELVTEQNIHNIEAPRSILLPYSVLRSGETVELQVSATYKNLPGSDSVIAIVKVAISFSGIRAIVAPPSTAISEQSMAYAIRPDQRFFIVPADLPLSLDAASYSFDYDSITALAQSDLTFIWECINATEETVAAVVKEDDCSSGKRIPIMSPLGACISRDGSELITDGLGTDGNLYLETSVLPRAGQAARFRVAVQHSDIKADPRPPNQRTAFFEIVVFFEDLVAAEEKPLVSIAPETRAIFLRSKHDPSSSLSVRAELAAGISVSGVKMKWQHDADTSRTPTLGFGSYSTSLDRPILVVRPDSLLPGETYAFRLKASTLSSSNNVNGLLTSIRVEINRAPRSGFVHIAPTSGCALTDKFEVTAHLFSDDPEDLPLRYNFAVVEYLGGGNDYREINLRSVAEYESSMQTIIPATSNVTVGIVAYVTDILGTTVRATKDYLGRTATITVLPLEIGNIESEEAVAFFNTSSNSLFPLLQMAGPSQTIPTLYSLANILSGGCLNGVFCSGNGRCGVDTAGVCKCFDGFGGHACEHTLSLANESSIKSNVAKRCHGDCSGHGNCIHVRPGTPVGLAEASLSVDCSHNEPGCATFCDCYTGWHGSACEMSNEIHALRQLWRSKWFEAVVALIPEAYSTESSGNIGLTPSLNPTMVETVFHLVSAVVVSNPTELHFQTAQDAAKHIGGLLQDIASKSGQISILTPTAAEAAAQCLSALYSRSVLAASRLGVSSHGRRLQSDTSSSSDGIAAIDLATAVRDAVNALHAAMLAPREVGERIIRVSSPMLRLSALRESVLRASGGVFVLQQAAGQTLKRNEVENAVADGFLSTHSAPLGLPSVRFPSSFAATIANTPAFSSTSRDGMIVVDFAITQWYVDPMKLMDIGATLSEAIDLNLRLVGHSTATVVRGFSPPVQLSLPLRATARSGSRRTGVCRFWNDVRWDLSGMITDSVIIDSPIQSKSNGYLTKSHYGKPPQMLACNTSHLSRIFVVSSELPDAKFMPPFSDSWPKDANLLYLFDPFAIGPLAIICILSIFVLWTWYMVFGFETKRALYGSDVAAETRLELETERFLKTGHTSISANDVALPWRHRRAGWRDTRTLKRRLQESTFIRGVYRQLRTSHAYIAAIWPYKISSAGVAEDRARGIDFSVLTSLTRYQRVAILWLNCLTILAINAIIYGTRPDTTLPYLKQYRPGAPDLTFELGTIVMHGAFSAACALPLTLSSVMLIRKLGEYHTVVPRLRGEHASSLKDVAKESSRKTVEKKFLLRSRVSEKKTFTKSRAGWKGDKAAKTPLLIVGTLTSCAGENEQPQSRPSTPSDVGLITIEGAANSEEHNAIASVADSLHSTAQSKSLTVRERNLIRARAVLSANTSGISKEDLAIKAALPIQAVSTNHSIKYKVQPCSFSAAAYAALQLKYERYAARTLEQQQVPVPREVFLAVCRLQSAWRSKVFRAKLNNLRFLTYSTILNNVKVIVPESTLHRTSLRLARIYSVLSKTKLDDAELSSKAGFRALAIRIERRVVSPIDGSTHWVSVARNSAGKNTFTNIADVDPELAARLGLAEMAATAKRNGLQSELDGDATVVISSDGEYRLTRLYGNCYVAHAREIVFTGSQSGENRGNVCPFSLGRRLVLDHSCRIDLAHYRTKKAKGSGGGYKRFIGFAGHELGPAPCLGDIVIWKESSSTLDEGDLVAAWWAPQITDEATVVFANEDGELQTGGRASKAACVFEALRREAALKPSSRSAAEDITVAYNLAARGVRGAVICSMCAMAAGLVALTTGNLGLSVGVGIIQLSLAAAGFFTSAVAHVGMVGRKLKWLLIGGVSAVAVSFLQSALTFMGLAGGSSLALVVELSWSWMAGHNSQQSFEVVGRAMDFQVENDCCGWSDPEDRGIGFCPNDAVVGCEAAASAAVASELLPLFVLLLPVSTISIYVATLMLRGWWLMRVALDKEMVMAPELSAARKIQALFRGRRHRRYQQHRNSILSALDNDPRVAKHAQAFAQRRDAAASRIQALFRGKLGRQRAQRMDEIKSWREQRSLGILLATFVGFVLWLLLGIFVVLVYGVKFNPELTVDWVLSSIFSIVVDVLLLHPTVAVFSFALAQYVRAPRARKRRRVSAYREG